MPNFADLLGRCSDGSADDVPQEVECFYPDYDLLRSLQHGGLGVFDQVPEFMSVLDAYAYLCSIQDGFGRGKTYREVAAAVLDPDNEIYGTPDEFFNFINLYLSAGDFRSAYDLARRALELYPHDVDLLSSALRACVGCARFDLCELVVAQLLEVPKKCWNWRAFLFLIDYYKTYLCACDVEKIDEVLEEGLEVAREYQRMLPLDERGYDSEAELLLYANRVEEAQAVLERAIFGTVPMADGTAVSLVAPACCVTMLDRVLGQSTDYRLTVRVAQRGVRNTAQEQPSANIGYFMYREALALDAQVCDARDDQDGFRNLERERAALVAYRCAWGMLEDRPAYRSTIERRYSILCHKSGIMDMPLEGEAQRD